MFLFLAITTILPTGNRQINKSDRIAVKQILFCSLSLSLVNKHVLIRPLRLEEFLLIMLVPILMTNSP